MPTTNTVTTLQARKKFAKARAGEITLPKIDKIAFGDGGHDAENEPVFPDSDLEEVPGEFIQKDVDEITAEDTTVKVNGTLTREDTEKTVVSAIGLYDEDGDLSAVKTLYSPFEGDPITFEVDWDEQY